MKRLLSTILTLIIILSNIAPAFAKTVAKNNSLYTELVQGYLEVLGEHSDAANFADNPYAVEYNKNLKYINEYFYAFGKEAMSENLRYAITDISDDGVPEMIIAEKLEIPYYTGDIREPSYLTWDIYGFNDNKIYSLFGEYASEKCRYYIMEDGIIKNSGRSGMGLYGVNYYKLDKNSVKPREIKSLEYHIQTTESDNYDEAYYDDNKKISESEFNKINNSYKEKNLKWYSIHDASGLYTFLIDKSGKAAPFNNVTKQFDDNALLAVQNCIKLLHSSSSAWDDDAYSVCDISALSESDIANLLIFISHYFQGYVGKTVDYPDDEYVSKYIKLSDIYNAAYKYFGIDIGDIFTRLPKDDFKNAPNIRRYYGNEVKDINGVKCINVGEQIDAIFATIPVIDKIYSLGNGTYYVLYKYDVDYSGINEPFTKYTSRLPDEEAVAKTGYAIIKSRFENGEKHYYIASCGANTKSFLSLQKLKRYISTPKEASNVTIDYKKVKSYTKIDQYVEYLENRLGNLKPNDSAKSEIIKYIEHAIESTADAVIKVKGKKIKITAEEIKEAINKAEKTKSEFDKLLDKKGISLSREIDITIRIDTQGASLKKGFTVIYDSSLTKYLDEISGIKIILDSDRQYLYCDAKELLKQADDNGIMVKIIVKDGKYNLKFMDFNGKKLKKAPFKFTFGFKLNSRFDTVYYHENKNKTNWSGQINDTDHTIEFKTALSGVYTIEGNEPEISDIGDLTDYEQETVKFMVSRGYFELDGNDFNPYGSLSRYEFTKTLVSIFYALDFDAKTTFTDVEKSSPYYEYIASSEQEDIVKGFGDDTFRGNNNTTREEVISISSRTLAGKKGYDFPENTDDYVQFADNADIEGWENQYEEIALAVREGLIDKGGILAPKSNVTRLDAAVILYRLFNCLYDVAPAQTPTQSSEESFPIGAAVAAGGAVVIAGGRNLDICNFTQAQTS